MCLCVIAFVDCANVAASEHYLMEDKHIFISRWQCPGDWFNIKVPSYQYISSNCRDKTILRPSILTCAYKWKYMCSTEFHIKIGKHGLRFNEISRNLVMIGIYKALHWTINHHHINTCIIHSSVQLKLPWLAIYCYLISTHVTLNHSYSTVPL